MNLGEAKSFIEDNDVDVLEIWTPDINATARGKRVPASKLSSLVDHGFTLADAIMCWPLGGALYEDMAFSNMETGYPDLHVSVALDTLRLLPWKPRTAVVVCEMSSMSGEPLAIDPHTALANQVRALDDLGMSAMIGIEVELYIVDAQGRAVSPYNEAYACDSSPLTEFVDRAAHELQAFGLPLDAITTEYGAAQVEITLRPTEAMAAATNAFLLKTAVKAIAARCGVTATFMPRPFTDQVGSGLHVNQSVLDGDGINLFDAATGSDVGTQWLAGLLMLLPELFLLGASNINSYKRIAANSFAPTNVTWTSGSRTAGLRAMFDRGQDESRIEFRSPGADANPYLAVAGCLAAGMHGVRNGLVPPPEQRGNAYTQEAPELQLPRHLGEAIERFRDSAVAKEAFGSEFIDHYTAHANHELQECSIAVTDWEVKRYLTGL